MEIGITGGALDSNEGGPGPILIQGDHGPIDFRKLMVKPAKCVAFAQDPTANGTEWYFAVTYCPTSSKPMAKTSDAQLTVKWTHSC